MLCDDAVSEQHAHGYISAPDSSPVLLYISSCLLFSGGLITDRTLLLVRQHGIEEILPVGDARRRCALQYRKLARGQPRWTYHTTTIAQGCLIQRQPKCVSTPDPGVGEVGDRQMIPIRISHTDELRRR